MPEPILITGCGSSGTKYISKVFKRGGLNIDHERIGAHGMSSWYAAVGPSNRRPPFNGTKYNQLEVFFKKPPIVLHQTRHPLKMISTCQRYSKGSWLYVCHFIPRINMDTPLILRCMLYWYYWTELADRLAVRQYQVEALPEIFEEWCKWLKRPELLDKKNIMMAESKTINSRVHRYTPLTWEDLFSTDERLANKIILKGRKYGYNIEVN